MASIPLVQPQDVLFFRIETSHFSLIDLDGSKDGLVEPQTGSDTNESRHEE